MQQVSIISMELRREIILILEKVAIKHFNHYMLLNVVINNEQSLKTTLASVGKLSTVVSF